MFHDAGGGLAGGFYAGTEARARRRDPQSRSYASYASFSDPDGNGWLLQEVTERFPGRVCDRRTLRHGAADGIWKDPPTSATVGHMGPGPTAHLPSPNQAASVFAGLRPRLFGVAYRVLGSAAEAEDVVQDAWLRWQATDHGAVLDPPAFLVTTTTRLAINVAQSARVRRETYIGPWLPEPVDTSADPALGAERGEALEIAVLMLLEKLPPTERAAYVLSEAFDYSYAQIADMLETSEANARQLASRARKHLAAERCDPVNPGEQRRLLEAFLVAARSGELGALESLFTSEGGRT